MHDPRLSEIASDLDRAAEDAAKERSYPSALRLLTFAADIRLLQRQTGDLTMGQVADRVHQYKQALIQANADRDAARADRDKDAADLQRFKDLEAAGRLLDDADVSALAEPIPGNGPTDNAGAQPDAGATVGTTLIPHPATDAAGTQPQPPA